MTMTTPNMYEAAARTAKATKIAVVLDAAGITPGDARLLEADDRQLIARAAQVIVPSTWTWEEAIGILEATIAARARLAGDPDVFALLDRR